MKIIAETTDGFLLEATNGEIALILGFRNSYDAEFKQKTIRIGTDIEIDKIDKVSKFVRTLEKDKLLKIKRDLENAITEIDEAVNNVQNITLFATLSED